MKYLSGLIFLAIVAYFALPYYHLYQIDNAVVNNNHAALEELIDIEEVRKVHKENVEWQINNTGPQGMVADAMRKGVKVLGDTAVDAVIDVNWILTRLHKTQGSLWQQLTFAFFESPTRFTIRLGQLGQDPVHIQMTMQDWYWRVTAVYE
ncbi:MAG: hypothetical protein DRQ57_04210 [Gammaproteobacteria bacterium]|nr:MAG: hypothetical protein DRQ57_04210 [Gammaproteobacteria bacterium]